MVVFCDELVTGDRSFLSSCFRALSTCMTTKVHIPSIHLACWRSSELVSLFPLIAFQMYQWTLSYWESIQHVRGWWWSWNKYCTLSLVDTRWQCTTWSMCIVIVNLPLVMKLTVIAEDKNNFSIDGIAKGIILCGTDGQWKWIKRHVKHHHQLEMRSPIYCL